MELELLQRDDIRKLAYEVSAVDCSQSRRFQESKQHTRFLISFMKGRSYSVRSKDGKVPLGYATETWPAGLCHPSIGLFVAYRVRLAQHTWRPLFKRNGSGD